MLFRCFEEYLLWLMRNIRYVRTYVLVCTYVCTVVLASVLTLVLLL